MKKILPFLFAISFLVSGCKIQPVIPTGVENIRFGAIDPIKGNVAVNMGLKINNPNTFPITIYALELQITVDGIALGKVSIADKFKIEKNTEAVYPVTANATLTDIIHSIPKIITAITKKESNVAVSGFIRVGSGIFKHTFPVNVNQQKVTTSGSN